MCPKGLKKERKQNNDCTLTVITTIGLNLTLTLPGNRYFNGRVNPNPNYARNRYFNDRVKPNTNPPGNHYFNGGVKPNSNSAGNRYFNGRVNPNPNFDMALELAR